MELINGRCLDPVLPFTKTTGWVEEIGDSVPKEILYKEDVVAVFGGWGCGVCVYCKNGYEQMCSFAKWPGITTNGGFAEYVLVDSYRFLVRVQKNSKMATKKVKATS